MLMLLNNSIALMQRRFFEGAQQRLTHLRGAECVQAFRLFRGHATPLLRMSFAVAFGCGCAGA
jgi:hypothetical protein